MNPKEYQRLYLGEFPPPPKEGDAVAFNGAIYRLAAIEPGGERDRAIITSIETGRTRNVLLSKLSQLPQGALP